MFERLLSVKYLTLKNSFVYLPTSSVKNINTGNCVKLTYGDKKIAYFSLSTSSTVDNESTIGISSLYAKALGIKENEFVNVCEISQLPTVNSITISPINKADYEVLEILAENVQSTLLEQIRVVSVNQKMVIWIGNNIVVTVNIDDIKPVCPGVIDFLTEVIIKNPDTKILKELPDRGSWMETDELTPEKSECLSDFIKIFEKGSCLLKNSQILKCLSKFYNYKSDLIFRIVSLNKFPSLENIKDFLQPFNVFLSKQTASKGWLQINSLNTPIFCLMTVLTPGFSVKAIYVRLCFFEDFLDNFHEKFIVKNIFVNESILKYLECICGSRVILKHIEKMPYINEIEIHTKKNYLVNAEEKLKIYLSENSKQPLIMNSDIVISTEDNLDFSLKFLPDNSKYCIIDDDFLRNCKYSVCDELVTPRDSLEEIFIPLDAFFNTSCFQATMDSILFNFSLNDQKYLENCLLSGKPGTGKTTLLKKVAENLRNYPHFVYTEFIYCKKVKGKTLDSLYKVFTGAFSKLVICQPSVLLIDDLHVLCENSKGEETPNSIYFNRVSEMLHNFLKLFSKFNTIGIIATTESASKLNKNVHTSRGNHLFKNLYVISDLNKTDRKKILINLFEKLNCHDLDFDDLSLKTEGFVVQDIVDFFNKTKFEAYKDEINENSDVISVSRGHCERALKNTCTLSLQNVNLHAPGERGFSDIGGLHDVKKIMVESMVWPNQYPTVFAGAPLRLQSGMLLYGPPGTGKTLLAGAAAKHCGLRLISIKGPELLSKYIGASEQAVRDVFEKAQSARPCILFFDEFDSLAPRRGHDNTGVTDRVVNQLLTQLDGVESLSGVCVLAATSRPDLLDPGLLRPGRLDRKILCPLPDTESRLEILRVLSQKLHLASDVDLHKIASSTEGFSGADLQAILYTAQLSSVDHLFENDDHAADVQELVCHITQKHLDEALEKTRPSLTKNERLKYDKIYTRFQGGSTDNFPTGTKATLA